MNSTSRGYLRSPSLTPHILVDRSLSHKLAKGLVAFNYKATHLDELMPLAPGEGEGNDAAWIRHVGTNSWIALCVNPEMFKNRLEMDALRESGARVFTLGSTNISGEMKYFIFGRWWLSILQRAQRPGPCLWRLYLDQPTRKAIR